MTELLRSILVPLSWLICVSASTDNATIAPKVPQGENHSKWVYPDKDGRLRYASTPGGDKIVDFSFAGYMGGGVALPDVHVVRSVKPSGQSDDTELIQQAIDAVSALPFNNGARGAVLLEPGVFTCAKSIHLSASGVVLRGSGSGPGGSTIRMVGEKHCAVVIGPTLDNQNARGELLVQTIVKDSYIPSGANSFTVVDSKGFAVGDVVTMQKPTTLAWLKFMQMDNLKRDGHPQTFIPTTRSGRIERTIKAIEGNKVTIEVPVSDSYDAAYLNPPGIIVSKSILAPHLSQVGIESIHIQCPPIEIPYNDAPYSALRVGGDDCWVRDVYCEETINSTTISGSRVTMQQVVVKHTFPNLGASKPADFSIQGSQILVDRCKASGGNTYFVWTGSLQSGPNVVLNCSFSGYGNRLQPHQRWATGLLFDNCRIPDGGIDFLNRGVAGSGHGWTMGWGVAWNCLAKTYIIQNPPGAINWGIGCIGERQQSARLFESGPILPEGEFDSFGENVAPQSLYLAQLQDRLGLSALIKIGYASNSKAQLEDGAMTKLPDLRYDEDPILGTDAAMYRPVDASNVREGLRKFGAEKALDGNPGSYWATDNGDTHPSMIVDMEGSVVVDAVEICEAPGFEGRVLEYKVEGQVDSDWKVLAQGTEIGVRKVDRFSKERVWKVRLTLLKLKEYAAIGKFSVYSK